MKNKIKILLLIVICIVSITLTSCDNSSNDDYEWDYSYDYGNNGGNKNNNDNYYDNYYDNTPSYYIVNLNSNNVGNYFNLDLKIVEKYYDTGHLLYYQIKVIKNCTLENFANLKFKVTASYNKSSNYFKYKSYDYPTVTVYNSNYVTTYSGSIFLTEKVSEVNIDLECTCTGASGSVKIY